MRFVVQPLLGLLCVLVSCANIFAQASGNHAEHFSAPNAHDHQHASSLQYKFIENAGQWPAHIKYRGDINKGRMWLEEDGFTYLFFDDSALRKEHTKPSLKAAQGFQTKYHALKLHFVDAFGAVELQAKQSTTEHYNFFKSKDRSKWRSKVKAYTAITYEDLYPDINLVLYSQDEFLKYDFEVAPYTDPKQIQLEYEGADALRLSGGELIVTTSVNRIIEQAPYAYQLINGKRQEVACKFVLQAGKVSFDFPEGYDEALPLVIDPVLIFASSSGSTADNFGMTATFDSEGNLFTGGITFDNGYPTTLGAFDSAFEGTVAQGNTDVVLSKYDSTGSQLIYSTYLGGNGTETVHSLIVDDQDQLLLYGVTSSTDFPVSNTAFDSTHAGGNDLLWVANGTRFTIGTDIFVSKFSLDGNNLLASTYVGGSGDDGVNYVSTNSQLFDSLNFNYGDQFRGEIMVDEEANVYIASATQSADFPIVGGFDNSLGGRQDGVVLKFTPDLSTLTWSSYLGGSAMDAAYNIKVDPTQQVYVCGGTNSQDFPVTAGSVDDMYLGGISDGFAATISPDGSTILAGTFLGSNAYDQSYFLEIDADRNIYILGQTEGSFPVSPNVYTNPNGGQFIGKYTGDLSTRIFSTVVGSGNGVDLSPAAFLVDFCGNIYFTGWGGNIIGGTALANMPLTADAFQTTTDGFDFYLMVLGLNAESLIYGSYFGGGTSREHVDGGTSRFDKNGVVYQSVCAGCGGNSDFPTTPGAWSETNLSSNCNNGVFKFDFEILPVASFTVSNTVGCSPVTVNFSNTSTENAEFLWDFGNGIVDSVTTNPSMTFVDTGTFIVTLVVKDTVCNLNDTTIQIITVFPSINNITVDASASTDTIFLGQSATLFATPPVGPISFSWFPTENVESPDEATTLVTPTTTTEYTVTINQGSSCGEDSAKVRIVVIEALCAEPDIFIPNAFTPNGDANNEVVSVKGNFIESLTFRIFNRYGQLVFESTDQSLGWDGTFEGKAVDPGVFVYYLEALCVNDEKFFKKGNITVIR